MRRGKLTKRDLGEKENLPSRKAFPRKRVQIKTKLAELLMAIFSLAQLRAQRLPLNVRGVLTNANVAGVIMSQIYIFNNAIYIYIYIICQPCSIKIVPPLRGFPNMYLPAGGWWITYINCVRHLKCLLKTNGTFFFFNFIFFSFFFFLFFYNFSFFFFPFFHSLRTDLDSRTTFVLFCLFLELHFSIPNWEFKMRCNYKSPMS